jgi:Tol biopolymer transport system component
MRAWGICFASALVALTVTGCGAGSGGPRGTIAVADDTLYLIPASGGYARRVTVAIADGPLGGVDLSPDGRRIAFAGESGIWVMRRDGSRARLIFDTRRALYNPGNVAWSPDGRRLAFDSYLSGVYEVFTISAGGASVRLVATAASQPAWSPDGRRIVFVREPDGIIYTIGVDGRGLRAIVRGVEPTVSPDGLKLAFGRRARPGYAGGIYVVPIAGGRPKLLARGGSYPEWSPDGRYLAFTRIVECGHAACSDRVFVVSAAGGSARAYGPKIVDLGPSSWSR